MKDGGKNPENSLKSAAVGAQAAVVQFHRSFGDGVDGPCYGIDVPR
jgi:hypothetical protein